MSNLGDAQNLYDADIGGFTDKDNRDLGRRMRAMGIPTGNLKFGNMFYRRRPRVNVKEWMRDWADRVRHAERA